MKLTGKCKKDFEKWLQKDSGLWSSLDEVYSTSLLRFNLMHPSLKWGSYQGFFDSHGLYIQIWAYKDPGEEVFFDCDVLDSKECRLISNTNFSKKRIDSITIAIEKANEIYNERQ